MFALGFRRRCFHLAAETSRCGVWSDTCGTPQRRASTSNELYRAHDPPACHLDAAAAPVFRRRGSF